MGVDLAGTAEVLSTDPPADDPRRADVHAISRGNHAVGGLVHRLLNLVGERREAATPVEGQGVLQRTSRARRRASTSHKRKGSVMPEPPQILVIDDNSHMVALIERWLRRAGYPVTGVTTVPEALEVLRAYPLAWVLTDLDMPTGHGMKILAYARAHQPQAKVIVMTGFGSEAMRQQVIAQGAHALLSKPFSGETLLAILSQEPSAAPTPSPTDGDSRTS
jgi:CheY-like chemotaxis protein